MVNNAIPCALDDEQIELLPNRETLALINVMPITAVNLGIAVDAASICSNVIAHPNQFITGLQGH